MGRMVAKARSNVSAVRRAVRNYQKQSGETVVKSIVLKS
jgi:hypothetical protein